MKRILLLIILCVSFIFTNMAFANNNKMSIKVLQNGTYSDTGINESNVINYSLSDDTLEMKLNKTGKQKLAEITKNSVGQKMAILYKGTIITEYTIREPITTGNVLVSGNDETLSELAYVLDNSDVSDKQENKKLILPISVITTCLLLLFGIFKAYKSEKIKNLIRNIDVRILWHIIALVFFFITIFVVQVDLAFYIPFMICCLITISPVFYWLKKFIKTGKGVVLLILSLATTCLFAYAIYDCLYTKPDEVILKIIIYAIILIVFGFTIFITNKLDKDTFIKMLKISVIPICAIFLVCGLSFGIYKDIEANSLPTCDSSFAENEVLEIFKQNNREYNELNNWGMVQDIKMSMIEPISYDKEIKKYECSARLTLYPSNTKVTGIPSKILPILSLTEFDYERKQYKRIGTKAMAFWGNVTCDVNYNIYKEHGENQVTSSYCSGGLKYDEPLYLPEVIIE